MTEQLKETQVHYCVDCGKNIVHSEGATCDLCMAEINEDYSQYDEEPIAIYKFR